MKRLSSRSFLAACAAVFLTVAASASANNVLLTQTSAFPTTGTATQTGRLVRNGVPQDFSGTETFPGTNNPTITFNYITFTLTPAQLAGGPYVQIELDSQGLNLFASAYLNSYSPGTSFQTNYLGDQGSSGDYSFTTLPITATDPSFFGVTVPAGNSLVIVIATAGAGGTGTGTPYSLEVENFSTTQYGPIAAAPEPSSLAAIGAGMLGLCAVMRFRRRAVVA